MRVATFSLVAQDPKTGDLGVAVASKFLAVGAVVPFAEAGVGAIATQSYANPRYGPQGLALLRQGASPEGVLEAFRRTDPGLEKRQFGLVAATGESLTFTGAECHPWAGGWRVRASPPRETSFREARWWRPWWRPSSPPRPPSPRGSSSP